MCDPIRVLHVDDHADFAEMAASFLEREDERLAVTSASGAEEGLAVLAETAVDCVVSDYEMPGRDGIAFLEAVREDHPDLPFILYTGTGSEEIASEAISAGVTDYVRKESGKEQYALLANRIDNVVSAHRSERAAEQRRHRLEQMLKTVPACIVRIDTDGEFTFANERAEAVLGMPPVAVSERNYNDTEWQITDLDGAPIPDEELPFRRVLDTGEPAYGCRHRIQTREGEQKLLRVDGAPLFDGEGNVESTLFALTDITERQERVARLEQLRQNVTDVVWISTPEKDSVEFISDSYRDVWGRSPESLEADPLSFLDGVHPDDRERVRAALTEQREDPDDYEETYRVVRPDGEVRWVLDRAAGVYEDGTLTSVVGISTDITERKERERELREEKAFSEAALAGAVDFYWVVDMDGYVRRWSDTDGSVTGYSAEEAVGQHSSTFHPDEHVDRIQDAIEQMKTGGSVRVEAALLTAAGERVPYSFTGTALTDDSGEIHAMCGLGRDISDRRERERELERQNERLEEFASIVSHDLRNPLNVASGRLELAREECDSVHLAAVDRAHGRMGDLIEDLLALARAEQETTNRTAVDVGRLAEQCWESVDTPESTLRVTAERTVSADESRLRQLFENLLRNAVEHGGRAVTVGDLDDGFYVADDGPGIPPEERETVFESGYTTRETGTGFGLDIVEQVAESHGWTVTVTEGDGGGARFEVEGLDDRA